MLIAKSYQGIGNMLVANAIRVAWAYLVVFIKMLLLVLCDHISNVRYYLLSLATDCIAHSVHLALCSTDSSSLR